MFLVCSCVIRGKDIGLEIPFAQDSVNSRRSFFKPFQRLRIFLALELTTLHQFCSASHI
jgi:hypothetical protein